MSNGVPDGTTGTTDPDKNKEKDGFEIANTTLKSILILCFILLENPHKDKNNNN